MKLVIWIAGGLTAVAAGTASAQQPTYKRDLPDSLMRFAKVTEAQAVAKVHQRIPTGRITALEMEREKSALIYSFDVTVPGKTGTEEVNIDAVTGKMWPLEHESAAAERRESAAEKRSAPKTRKP